MDKHFPSIFRAPRGSLWPWRSQIWHIGCDGASIQEYEAINPPSVLIFWIGCFRNSKSRGCQTYILWHPLTKLASFEANYFLKVVEVRFLLCWWWPGMSGTSSVWCWSDPCFSMARPSSNRLFETSSACHLHQNRPNDLKLGVWTLFWT